MGGFERLAFNFLFNFVIFSLFSFICIPSLNRLSPLYIPTDVRSVVVQLARTYSHTSARSSAIGC